MINDAGKHHVNAGNELVSLRAGLWPDLHLVPPRAERAVRNDEDMQ